MIIKYITEDEYPDDEEAGCCEYQDDGDQLNEEDDKGLDIDSRRQRSQ